MPNQDRNRKVVLDRPSSVSAPFDPFSLGFILDLRTPIEPLTEETERTNGLVVPLSPGIGIASSPSIAAIIDQSQGKSLQTPEYVSDFSIDEDGFTGTQATPTGGITIGGQNNFMRIAGNSSNAVHYVEKTLSITTGLVHYSVIDVFIEESNVVVDGIVLNGAYIKNIPKGSIQRFIAYQYSLSTSTVVALLSGSSVTFDDGGESVYVKSISFAEVDGNHFVQPEISKMPSWDNVDCNIQFNGTNNEMRPINTNLVTLVNSDQQGCVYLVFEDTIGSGNFCWPFTFQNIATALFGISFSVDNTIRIISVSESVSNEFITDAAQTRSTKNKWLYQVDDSTGYQVRVNGVTPEMSGDDDGYWNGDIVGADDFKLGGYTNFIFHQFDFHGLFMRRTPLLTSEADNLDAWADVNL